MARKGLQPNCITEALGDLNAGGGDFELVTQSASFTAGAVGPGPGVFTNNI